MLKDSQISDSTGYLLSEVARQLRAIFDAEMSQRGLTGAAWRTMAYLSLEDGQTQAQLAGKLEISRVAMGQMIDRLERDGWIERRPDETDRRAWRIHITDAFRRELPAFRSAAKDLQRRCFSGLSEAQNEKLKRLLLQLRDHLQGLRAESAREEDNA